MNPACHLPASRVTWKIKTSMWILVSCCWMKEFFFSFLLGRNAEERRSAKKNLRPTLKCRQRVISRLNLDSHAWYLTSVSIFLYPTFFFSPSKNRVQTRNLLSLLRNKEEEKKKKRNELGAICHRWTSSRTKTFFR